MVIQFILILSILITGFAIESFVNSLSNIFSIENYEAKVKKCADISELKILYEELLLLYGEFGDDKILDLLHDVKNKL